MAAILTQRKQNGEYDFSLITRWLDTTMSMAEDDTTYDIVVRKHQSRRTNAQNRLMWMWFECIADECGETAQNVHDHYCTKFLLKPVEYNGSIELHAIGTSGLEKTTEFPKFLKQVQADAATELGIILPDPEDAAYAAFCEQYDKSYFR